LEYDEISLLGGSLPNFQAASLLLFSQSVEPCKQQHFPIVHLGCVSGDFLLSTMETYQLTTVGENIFFFFQAS